MAKWMILITFKEKVEVRKWDSSITEKSDFRTIARWDACSPKIVPIGAFVFAPLKTGWEGAGELPRMP